MEEILFGITFTFMGLIYSPEDQKKVEAKIEAGISASTQEAGVILRQIHEAVWDLNTSEDRKMSHVMAMFATLTVSLSIKADRIQRWMVGLTVAITVMTAVLIALTCVLLFK